MDVVGVVLVGGFGGFLIALDVEEKVRARTARLLVAGADWATGGEVGCCAERVALAMQKKEECAAAVAHAEG